VVGEEGLGLVLAVLAGGGDEGCYGLYSAWKAKIRYIDFLILSEIGYKFCTFIISFSVSTGRGEQN